MPLPPDSPFSLAAAVALVAFREVDRAALLTTAEVLAEFQVICLERVLRGTPGEIPDFSAFTNEVAGGGVRLVIVAAAEGRLVRALAAHLTLPVIRLPVAVDASAEAGLAVLLEGAGPGAETDATDEGAFATVALGEAGARNAALLAVSILALTDERLRAAWKTFREAQTQAVLAQPPPAG